MSYVKNTWENGDVITAEKLNNMEDGISTAIESFIICHLNNETDALDVQAGELFEAYQNGIPIYAQIVDNTGTSYWNFPCIGCSFRPKGTKSGEESGSYTFLFVAYLLNDGVVSMQATSFVADGEDEYPVMVVDNGNTSTQ